MPVVGMLIAIAEAVAPSGVEYGAKTKACYSQSLLRTCKELLGEVRIYEDFVEIEVRLLRPSWLRGQDSNLQPAG